MKNITNHHPSKLAHVFRNSKMRIIIFFVIMVGLVISGIYSRGNRERQAPLISPWAVAGTYQFKMEPSQSGTILLTLELALDQRVILTEDFGQDRIYVQEGFWSFDGRELVTRLLTKEEPSGSWEPRPPRILRWNVRIPEEPLGLPGSVNTSSENSNSVADPFQPLEIQLTNQVLQDIPSNTVLFQKEKGPQVTGVVWEWIRTVTPKEVFEPQAPENHTLYMDVHGAIGLLIGCNRGGGEVTLIPSDSFHPVSGSIELGNIFSTMMYCPDQETADRFSRELQVARIYFLKDQILHLDLFADGGTMMFRPRIAGIAEGER